MGLDVFRYFYKPNQGRPSDKPFYGPMAESVVKVLPELVDLDSGGQPNSVDLVGMIPVLIHAVQQQQAEILALKKGLSRHAHRR